MGVGEPRAGLRGVEAATTGAAMVVGPGAAMRAVGTSVEGWWEEVERVGAEMVRGSAR